MDEHMELLKAVDKYIEKADKDLEKALKAAGYANPKATVKAIENLEDNITDRLGVETEDFIKKLNDAGDSGISLEDFIDDELDSILEDDAIDDDLKKLFKETFEENMLKTVSAYIKTADPDLIAEEISAKTAAWMEEWSDELAGLMKMGSHKEVNDLLTDGLTNGDGCRDVAAKIEETGLRAGYRARTVAVTEMLRAHSVAQNEAIMQNPSVELKEWVHTGSYRNTPRENHEAMNGVQVPKDSKFTLTLAKGGTIECDFPRDPVLPVGEVANCHCMFRGIVSEKALGLSLDERKRLQAEALASMDDAWETEQNENNKSKAGIE